MRDKAAKANPTRRASKKKDSEPEPETVEARTFPDEAKVLSIMAHGFSYEDAWNMSYRDYGRYSGIAAAWSIPPDEREGSVRVGTKADQDMLL